MGKIVAIFFALLVAFLLMAAISLGLLFALPEGLNLAIVIVLWFFFFVLLVMAFLGGGAYCTYYSYDTVNSNEVALRRRFGRIEVEYGVIPPGTAWVPWFLDFELGGLLWHDLARIPTTMFRLKYEGTEEHELWSSDGIRLTVEASAYVRFPYEEAESLAMLIQSRVPLTQDELSGWMEEEVIAVTRKVLAGFTYREAIAKSNWDSISDQATVVFRMERRLLCRSGVCGRNPDDTHAGCGEVYLVAELVGLTEALRVKMEQLETSKIDVDIAEKQADKESIDTSGALDRMVDERLKKLAQRLNLFDAEGNPDPSQLREELGDDQYMALLEDYNSQSQDMLSRDRARQGGRLVEVRSSGPGNPSGDVEAALLKILSLVGVIKSGLGDQGGQGNPGGQTAPASGAQPPPRGSQPTGRQGRRKGRGASFLTGVSDDDVENMSDEELARRLFEQNGIYPKWDPLKRTPN